MRRNEEGELELVVGNRQLLSVLFIMFVLFGAVFSMGYFVGRSTAPEPAAQGPEAKMASAENPAQPRSALPPPPVEAQAPPTAAADAPLEPGQAKVTPAATPIPDSKPPEKPKPAAAESAVPLPGQTYLQVAAVGKPEAELVMDSLKKRGFSALVAPVPNDTRWRALVGPLPDAASLAKARSDLLALGFKDMIVRKY
jgi:cell division protein FtsN